MTKSEKQKFIFRGQSSSRYDVSSGAYRVVKGITKNNDVNTKELKRYHELLLEQAHKINSEEERELSASPFELLAVLQHGGAKTGLIDFSYNPLIALFFACQTDNEYKNDDGVVYYVKKMKFAVINDNCTIGNIFEHDEERYNYILDPVALNARILSQQGCFIIPNIGRIDEMAADRFIIPNSCKKEILKTLENLGISNKELFKDFYGFCGWGADLIVESFSINDVIMRLQNAMTYIFINEIEKAVLEINEAEKMIPLIQEEHPVVVRWLYQLKADLAVEEKNFLDAIYNYELSIEKDSDSRIVPNADNFGRCIDIIETIELLTGQQRDGLLVKQSEFAKVISDFVRGIENERLSSLLNGPEEHKARRELLDDIKILKLYEKAKHIIEENKL